MIITASEANSLVPEENFQTTEDICQGIKSLALHGFKSALWKLRPSQIKEFETLGYVVEKSYTEYVYRITWKK